MLEFDGEFDDVSEFVGAYADQLYRTTFALGSSNAGKTNIVTAIVAELHDLKCPEEPVLVWLSKLRSFFVSAQATKEEPAELLENTELTDAFARKPLAAICLLSKIADPDDDGTDNGLVQVWPVGLTNKKGAKDAVKSTGRGLGYLEDVDFKDATGGCFLNNTGVVRELQGGNIKEHVLYYIGHYGKSLTEEVDGSKMDPRDDYQISNYLLSFNRHPGPAWLEKHVGDADIVGTVASIWKEVLGAEKLEKLYARLIKVYPDAEKEKEIGQFSTIAVLPAMGGHAAAVVHVTRAAGSDNAAIIDGMEDSDEYTIVKLLNQYTIGE